MSDGFVSGVIINSLDTIGSVNVAVSCADQFPDGSISGIVQFFRNGQLQKYEFSSARPISVKTTNSKTSSHVNTSFKNVVLKNVMNGTVSKNCSAFLTATGVAPDTWSGRFTVTCPNGPRLTIFGVFEGIIQVNKQVNCNV